jgi:UDP-N-acetylglucosamine--N-acetylmuramyl-(pentapeptide) pyrophosphoryl-undecaprenol N-acetylglucosamine transferase
MRCRAFASNDEHAVVTGAPLRDEIIAIDRSPSARLAARAELAPPIDDDRSVVVVMTGSLGAQRVNRAVSDLAQRWADRRDVTIVHVTGRRDFESVSRARPRTDGLDYRIVEFGDMTRLWAVCDVAVCRAGAATVAELTALSIASVLVPLPNAPGDHQAKNAAVVADAGGAVVIADAQCDARSLADALDQILAPSTREQMERCARSLGRPESSDAIAQVVMEVGRW